LVSPKPLIGNLSEKPTHHPLLFSSPVIVQETGVFAGGKHLNFISKITYKNGSNVQ
jgi:hypothetical protein